MEFSPTNLEKSISHLNHDIQKLTLGVIAMHRIYPRYIFLIIDLQTGDAHQAFTAYERIPSIIYSYFNKEYIQGEKWVSELQTYFYSCKVAL
jgi:hypothetical protein